MAFPYEGTVSHGTLLEHDLIPAFLDTLKEINEKAWNSIVEEGHLMITILTWKEHGWLSLTDEGREQISYYVNEWLFPAMDDQAPEGYYFGAHPGDGSDFGYWPMQWKCLGCGKEGDHPDETVRIKEKGLVCPHCGEELNWLS